MLHFIVSYFAQQGQTQWYTYLTYCTKGTYLGINGDVYLKSQTQSVGNDNCYCAFNSCIVTLDTARSSEWGSAHSYLNNFAKPTFKSYVPHWYKCVVIGTLPHTTGCNLWYTKKGFTTSTPPLTTWLSKFQQQLINQSINQSISQSEL